MAVISLDILSEETAFVAESLFLIIDTALAKLSAPKKSLPLT